MAELTPTNKTISTPPHFSHRLGIAFTSDVRHFIQIAKERVEAYKVTSKSRDQHAEVHTPSPLIRVMLNRLPDPEPGKTWLDPCAGIGNFCLEIVDRATEDVIDPRRRYREAIENEVFMVEIQPKNCVIIERLFNPTGEFNLNLKCCDAFELEYENLNAEDWQKHRFRTSYVGSEFFDYEPSDDEYDKLQEIRKIDPIIARRFEIGI